jgi:hypothetical protein
MSKIVNISSSTINYRGYKSEEVISLFENNSVFFDEEDGRNGPLPLKKPGSFG